MNEAELVRVLSPAGKVLTKTVWPQPLTVKDWPDDDDDWDDDEEDEEE